MIKIEASTPLSPEAAFESYISEIPSLQEKHLTIARMRRAWHAACDWQRARDNSAKSVVTPEVLCNKLTEEFNRTKGDHPQYASGLSAGIAIVRRHFDGRPAVEGKPLELMTRDELLSHIHLQEAAAFIGNASPTPNPGLPMSQIEVGMQLRSTTSPTFPVITVTEVTDKGFRYTCPCHSFGSRLGWSEGGECFGVDGNSFYEPAETPTSDKPGTFTTGNLSAHDGASSEIPMVDPQVVDYAKKIPWHNGDTHCEDCPCRYGQHLRAIKLASVDLEDGVIAFMKATAPHLLDQGIGFDEGIKACAEAWGLKWK